MIIVIAPYPSDANQKDGMIQRVAHIDEVMEKSQRIYMDLSFRRFFYKDISLQGFVTIYRLNLFIHFLLIWRLLKSADILYIHSAYNALKVMLFPTDAYIIFDAHGIVPEELVQEGHTLAAKVFAIAERHALSRCDTLVCVTRSMLRHFKAKYGSRYNREEIILPILPKTETEIKPNTALYASRDICSVIYAGGMQVWQNVDKMIVAASRQPTLTYTFLSGFSDAFKVRLQAASLPWFSCESVPPAQVKDYYLKHQFGFVLREPDLVNSVACPTKLVEYLYWGVVPIVITPRIGDFDETNLSAVTLEAFMAGAIPTGKSVDDMRRRNQDSVMALFASAQLHEDRLREILRDHQQ